MSTKRFSITGWAYAEETAAHLRGMMNELPLDDILFSKQDDANKDRKIKRMTIKIEISDYDPKRKKT